MSGTRQAGLLVASSPCSNSEARNVVVSQDCEHSNSRKAKDDAVIRIANLFTPRSGKTGKKRKIIAANFEINASVPQLRLEEHSASTSQ